MTEKRFQFGHTFAGNLSQERPFIVIKNDCQEAGLS